MEINAMQDSIHTSDVLEHADCKIQIRKSHFPIRLMKIAWIVFWLGFATFLVFPPITIVSFFSKTGNFACILSRMWAWVLLKTTRVKVEVQGREKIDPKRSYMIISNHQSHFDGPALAAKLGLQFRCIAKKELLKIPLFGYSLYAARHIFIDRTNREKAIESIQTGMKRIPSGVSVMCFAEGTRSGIRKINEFKKGGFVAALETGFPILPIAINGSAKVLPKKSIVFQPGPIQIVVGDPIDTADYSRDTLDQLIAKTRDTIISNFRPDFPDP